MKSVSKGRLSAPTTGALGVFFGAVMISFSGIYVKLADVGPSVSGLYRVFFGGLLLTAILAIRRERVWLNGRYAWLQIACGFFLAVDLFFYHLAIHIIGMGLSTIIANFQVFFVSAFGAMVLGEHLTIRFKAAIPLAFVGLYLIVGIDWSRLGDTYQAGVGVGFGAAVFYAVFILILRHLQARPVHLSPRANLAVVTLSAALFFGMFISFQAESFAIPNLKSAACLVAYGFFSQVIGWVLITRGMPGIHASLAGLLLLSQPALAFLWDNLFFGRETSLVSWFGAALTLSAIYLGTTGRASKPDRT